MKPTGLTAEQEQTLLELIGLWGTERTVLIGASALACYMAMPTRTLDLDLSVSISIDDYPAGLDGLSGWKRHSTREHEWHAPNGVRVDVLPCLTGEELIWPESRHRMSLAGHRLAFDHARRLEFQETETLVAPPTVIATMKIIAYSERPEERQKDLEHLGHLLEHYVDDDDDRRYSPKLIEAELMFDEQAAFLLGSDMGQIIGPQEWEFVNCFVRELSSDDGLSRTQVKLLALGPPEWRRDADQLRLRTGAFEKGLRSVKS